MKIQWNSIRKLKHGVKDKNITVLVSFFEYLSILSGVIIIILIFEDLECWEGATEKPKIKYV